MRLLRTFDGRRALAVVAGPALIVVSVLGVLHTFVLHSLLTSSDVLRYWMPTYCLMGRSLAHGHIAGWNPFVMGGAPFAADPQSGWMYAPAMALFAALPCGLAIRWMIVVLPLVGGLGLLAFLRAEGLSRISSTAGGVVLALTVAGSEVSLSLPFSGTLAWTAVALACASRWTKADRRHARIWWAVLTALAWGQLAAAHFSVGALMGTLAILAYLIGRMSAGAVRPGRIVALLAGFPLVNLAYLVPRLAYVPETSLGQGYSRLQDIADLIGGRPLRPFAVGPASPPTWPLKLATSPGAHLGAVALVLVFGAFWSRRHRALAVAFGAFAALCYVLSLHRVASLIPNGARHSRFVAFYLHSPEWFAYAALLALAVLAAIGIEAWMEPRAFRDRVSMVAPGLFVWLVLPFGFGASFAQMALLLGALAVGVAILALGARVSAILLAVPVLLAVELGINGSIGPEQHPPFGVSPINLEARSRPTVDPNEYLRPGPLLGIVRREDDGRHLVVARLPPRLQREAAVTRVLIPDLSMAYGTEEAAAFQPVQLLRYWILSRASQRNGWRVVYNRSQFLSAPPIDLDLFQVAWVVGRSDRPPPAPGLEPVAAEGRWRLYRRSAPHPRASFVPSWVVVPPSPNGYRSQALSRVVAPGFDPERQAVLEEAPRVGPSSSRGSSGPSVATYRATGLQSATVTVRARRRGLVLVRTPWDPNWHATVDGRPARLLRADYLFQAVPVDAGSHVVALRYDDPRIGYGLAGSAVVLGGLLGIALISLLRSRRRARAARTSRAPTATAEPTAP